MMRRTFEFRRCLSAVLAVVCVHAAGSLPVVRGQADDNVGTISDDLIDKGKWSWVASPEYIKGRTWLAQTGRLTATLDFEPTVFGETSFALECDGTRQAAVASTSIAAAQLPTKAITLEAWVMVRSAAPSGGMICALQDNGDFERGMLLGYRETKFCLAIATKAAGKLTYLAAGDDFAMDTWHHVVGTFDGQTMSLYVDGQLTGTSEEQQGEIWFPPSGVVVLGAYRDDDELYRLNGMLHSATIYDRSLSAADVKLRFAKRNGTLPLPFESADSEASRPEVFGPFVTSIDDNTWSVEWQSDSADVGYVDVGPTKYQLRRVPEDTSASTNHRVMLRDLPRDRVHQIRIGGRDVKGQDSQTRLYPLDTMLNYPPPPAVKLTESGATESNAAELNAAGASAYATFAEKVLQAAQVDKGYAVVLDGTGELAIELAKRSRLQIVVVQPDQDIARMAREKLHAIKLYGTRVTVQQRPLDQLDIGPFVANIVVSDPIRWSKLPTRPSFDNLYAIIKPAGGLLFVGGASEDSSWTKNIASTWIGRQVDGRRNNASDAIARDTNSTDTIDWIGDATVSAMVMRRGKLPGAGEWTHQYGLPNNTSCSEDETIRGDMSVLWWGRPGPRPMPDRGPRNPAPVSANGRLYIQGNRTLFGLDSYNGSILWFQQIPTMRRANIPRDCSNMVATDDYLYLAMQGRCLGIAGQSGARELLFSIPGDELGNERRFDWGIVACQGELLFGSAVKRGSQYLGDNGEWFEESGENDIARVTSAKLFALDRHSGAVVWQYDRGAIVNSTFSLDKRTVYFLESRSDAATTASGGRLLKELQSDQYLVALNQSTGDVLWEHAVDLSHCEFMTYMSVAADTLIVAGTDNKKNFHTQAFSSISGKELWQHTTTTRKTHHSGHLAHPLVIDDRVYVNKLTFDRETGKVLNEDNEFDWHGCGVTSASRHTIFRRYEYHGMLDLETNKRTEFLGVRSGCWLSLIPSGGTLLAPETSAGCSCTHAVQTSLAYVPRYFLPKQDDREQK